MKIEQKAKAYDEALKKAKDMLSYKEVRREDMEYLFPELKESEDERIVKELLTFFRESTHGGHILTNKEYDSWIAWLEKQEQKTQGKSALEAIKEEKVDNQNCVYPAKVESKFKVGDWVVYDHRAYQVVEFPKEGYINLGLRGNGKIEFAPSTYCRHWTIQDAKDGDVLFIGIDASTCIFKKLEGNLLYNYIISDGKLLVEDSHYYYETSDNIHPATKEQRNLLFQKMREAGYEWDEENKELKKIEQKFDIEIPFGAKDSELQEWSYSIPEGFYAEIKDSKVFIKKGEQKPTDEEMKRVLQTEYEKGRADALAEMQKSWSEEDEKQLNNIMWIIEAYRKNGFNETHIQIADNSENWLKSFKDRVQPHSRWKPSEIQKDCIEQIIDGEPYNRDVLIGLFNDLKKL